MRGMQKWEDTAEFYRFPIASVSKEDLEARGFDVSLIDGDKMVELAARMEEEYLRELFWFSLESNAKRMGMPMKIGK